MSVIRTFVKLSGCRLCRDVNLYRRGREIYVCSLIVKCKRYSKRRDVETSISGNFSFSELTKKKVLIKKFQNLTRVDYSYPHNHVDLFIRYTKQIRKKGNFVKMGRVTHMKHLIELMSPSVIRKTKSRSIKKKGFLADRGSLDIPVLIGEFVFRGTFDFGFSLLFLSV